MSMDLSKVIDGLEEVVNADKKKMESLTQENPYPTEKKPKKKKQTKKAKPVFETIETDDEDIPVKDWKTEKENAIKGLKDGEICSKARVTSFAFTVWEKKEGKTVPTRYRRQPFESFEHFVNRAIEKGDKIKQDVKIDTAICTNYSPKLDALSFQDEIMVKVRPDQIEKIVLGDFIDIVTKVTPTSVYFEMN